MDLWIRSQEGRISRIVDILEPRETEKSGLKGGWGIYAFNFCGGFLSLGYYKTKEQALEVLDDIETFKEYMIMYEHQNEEYKDRVRLFLENKGHKLGTYYMPKE